MLDISTNQRFYTSEERLSGKENIINSQALITQSNCDVFTWTLMYLRGKNELIITNILVE